MPAVFAATAGRPRARNQTGRKRHNPFLASSIAAPSPRLSADWKSAMLTPAVSTTIAHAEAIGTREGHDPRSLPTALTIPRTGGRRRGNTPAPCRATSEGTPTRSSSRDPSAFNQTAARRTTSTSAGRRSRQVDSAGERSRCTAQREMTTVDTLKLEPAYVMLEIASEKGMDMARL